MAPLSSASTRSNLWKAAVAVRMHSKAQTAQPCRTWTTLSAAKAGAKFVSSGLSMKRIRKLSTFACSIMLVGNASFARRERLSMIQGVAQDLRCMISRAADLLRIFVGKCCPEVLSNLRSHCKSRIGAAAARQAARSLAGSPHLVKWHGRSVRT